MQSNDCTEVRSRASHPSLLKLMLFNLGISTVVPFLIYLFNPNLNVSRLWFAFLESLVYSNLIGTLGWIVMPRLWPWAYRKPFWIKYPAAVFGLLGISVVGSAVGLGLLWLLNPVYQDPSGFWRVYLRVVQIATVLSMAFGGASIVIETFRSKLHASNLELRTRELERERALKLATEARLSSLQSRLQPHFLFNALNSISALIRTDPARAERLIERMSAILRYSLDTNALGLVSMEQELRIVSDYLEIESARFGSRLRFTIDVPEELHHIEVPPFSIQTLVENSVKYGVATRREGGSIQVRSAMNNGRLTVSVTDDGPGFDPNHRPAGHGLDTLESRLTALFGKEGTLEFTRAPGSMTVNVTLPARSAVPA
jgi:two-component system, LytTR family, sensor histidine kinase AlgZ